METIFYFERLTNGTFLGTRAHCAGRDALGVADVDGSAADIAHDPLLPQVQVDGGQRCAGDARIEERVRHIEHGSLDNIDLVAVVANQFGQGDLPDLGQLGLREPDERIPPLVPEPVAFSQIPELNSNDAGEGWSHQASVQWCLGQSAWK